ncbi:fungal-specific transcription factor domain-containing protein [Polyplosphaeria fusca]|uniref:Fungal-specific transcription factor domain-containing protein n=1 Tax=Polyplosphaeria fusca TaxID=682080 RepID=A0A9P4R3S4_9PLEO|nr:fungal-specific transcription factor domain-containing protein [Polyplosphaeria fusca]
MADQAGSHPSSLAAASERRAHREQPRIRRRNRLITSCLECRRRKLKCDKQQPCSNCIKFARDCVFLAPGLDPVGQAKLAEVKEKMGMLERTLEEDVARKGSSASPSAPNLGSPPLPGQDEEHSDQEEAEDEKGLTMLTTAIEDANYYEDDGNDELVDLGIQMGKLRINERIGGLVRPRFSEELAQSLKAIPDNPEENPFVGQRPSTWLSPSNDYVAPSSSFFFAPGVEKTSLMTYLPAKALTDKLIDHYWLAVHVIARTVHRPSFERKYERFWNDVHSGVEPRVSFQAVVLAALLSSVISMSEEKLLADFGVDKNGLVDNFRQGTESALARANFLRTTKLETLQAFVMYLIPLVRAEVSRAHSALTGTCIRLAECMGLHRDPALYTSNPIETHVRRLVWFQICFLDIRTCEATGPRPQIRREEYDTYFPLNVDDLEKKKTTLTSLLSKIAAFRKAMEQKYRPMMNTSNALHVLAMEIYGILSDRMYVMVLQKYASNDKRMMPERLRQMMLSSAVTILEHSMNIEQTPALSPWVWYVGALHQYHTSLLLLHELYIKVPDPSVEARVWRCIDFCFDLPPNLTPSQKSRMVLGELVDRTSVYQSMRRNEFEQYFGVGEEQPAEYIMIPPFSFPTFSGQELQWPQVSGYDVNR